MPSVLGGVAAVFAASDPAGALETLQVQARAHPLDPVDSFSTQIRANPEFRREHHEGKQYVVAAIGGSRQPAELVALWLKS